MSRILNIIGLHNVNSSWCFPMREGAGVRGLERMLRALARAGTPMPLDDALGRLDSGGGLPRGAFCVTFDDGYADNLSLAAPLLERLGVSATFFLVPDLLSRETTAWWERLGWAFVNARSPSVVFEGAGYALHNDAESRHSYDTLAARLKRRDCAARERAVDELVELCDPSGRSHVDEMFLDWHGARELSERGFGIGSHSERHRILTQESPAAQAGDLRMSRERLQSQLGVAVDLLAYPNGTAADFDEHTIAAAKDAGYSYALTTVMGSNTPDTPPYELRRWVAYPERGVWGLGVIGAQYGKAKLRRAAERV